MKTSLKLEGNHRRNSKPARRLKFQLAAGLACVCLGAGLLLPVLKNRAGHRHAMPPGQFQADMRTLFAGMHYLFEAEPAVDHNPATFAGRNGNLAQSSPELSPGIPDGPGDRTAKSAVAPAESPAPI